MKRNLKRLGYFIKDKNKKSYFTMLKEVVKLWVNQKEFPLHYFGRKLYRKDAPKNIEDYLTLKQYNLINALIVHKNSKNPKVLSILNNKLDFYNFCTQHDIPTPEIYSYNSGNTFYYNTSEKQINTAKDLQEFFLKIFDLYEVERLFLKPTEGSGGFGALMLTKEKLNTIPDQIYDILKDANYIHQAAIVQHPIINEIHHNAINTLRIETFRDSNKNIHFLGTFMRFGHGKMEVDNASSGGFMVLLNIETGRLFPSGARSLIYGTERITKHPDSGFIFDGFKVPFIEEIKALIIKLNELLPAYVHGWDIAISNTGPVVIEGNYSPGFLFSEQSYGGHKNKPCFTEILKDAEIFKKSQL